jgi:peptidoglycan/LPS O-acetylase OafA/YrhL
MSGTETQRLPSLDGLRAIAIGLVIAGHASGSAGWPLHGSELERLDPVLFNAVLGVRVFFVISGFLITTLLLREESRRDAVSLRAFYTRRALRILPVIFAYVAVVAVFELSIGRRVLAPFVHALTFTTGGFFDGGSSKVLGHMWSLSVEEQFYIFWPLLFARAGNRMRIVAALAITLLAPVVRAAAYVGGQHWLAYQTILGNMDMLMVGCLLALTHATRPELVRAIVEVKPTLGRALAIGVGCAMQWVSGPSTAWFTVPLRPLLEALIVAYLIASLTLVRRGALYRALNLAPVAWVGVLSYSLYVWQQLFLYPGGGDGYEAFAFQTLPLNLLLTVVAATLSYYVVERPFLRIKERFSG